jgi:uncharacterized protein (DUF362 family)
MSSHDQLSRRDFLVRTGKAAGLSALTVGGAFAFHVDERHPFAPDDSKPMVRDLRIKGIRQELAVVHGQDPALMTRAALEHFGGMKSFVAKGDVVLVKPNIGWDRMPAQAANTNPDVIRALVRECLAAGAAKVIVTDITCNEAGRCFQRSGIEQAAKEAGAEVERPSEGRYKEVNLGGKMLGKQLVYQPFLEADKLINVPIAKHHSLSGATLGMKNLYGILGGNRSRLHQDIHNSLADLLNFLRPTLTIVDAIRVLRRNGPQGGNTADVETHNMMIASTDPVAADAYAADKIFALRPEQRAFLALAADFGLGSPDYASLPVKDITV